MNKRITFLNDAGSLCVFIPALGARLVASVKDQKGDTIVLDPPQPAYTISHDTSVLDSAAVSGLIEWAETEDEFMQRLLATKLPAGSTNPRICTTADLPSDRSFRNAWTQSGARVVVAMPRARMIHMDRLRKRRTDVFPKLDADWMRAMGQKDQAEADRIEAKRQALRDMPQTLQSQIEAAATPEELGVITHAELQ